MNFVSDNLKDAMNKTSGGYPHSVDEFELADLPKGQSKLINVPFVKDAPAAFECKLFKEVPLLGDAVMVIGQVIGVHLNETYIKDGLWDVTAYQPLARLGYADYAHVSEVFSLERP